jgi:hypothetical protein
MLNKWQNRRREAAARAALIDTVADRTYTGHDLAYSGRSRVLKRPNGFESLDLSAVSS